LVGTANVVLARSFFSPWWWRRYVPPNRRFSQEPHGVTSQKTAFSTWVVITDNVPSSLILSTLRMEAIRSSETSARTRATLRHIPEDGILHSHRHGNLRSYIALTGWTL
jgi:hypothetical protein